MNLSSLDNAYITYLMLQRQLSHLNGRKLDHGQVSVSRVGSRSTTRRYIAEDRTLHNYLCEILKSYIQICLYLFLFSVLHEMYPGEDAVGKLYSYIYIYIYIYIHTIAQPVQCKGEHLATHKGMVRSDMSKHVQNRIHVYMNFFDHKDLGNHLVQLCPKIVKHPV
jgi:hypothetical protein